MMKENGTFRHKDGFTAVGNKVVRDNRLSIKAKGLYSIMQSYITCPGLIVTKGFLLSRSTDGEKSFESGWDELKEGGYLKTHITPGDDGRMRAEYDLLDEPKLGAHTFYYSRSGELTNTNLTRNKNAAKTGTERYPQKGGDASGGVAESGDADGSNNIIHTIRLIDNTVYKNQYINQGNTADEIDGYDKYKEIIMENIEYGRLADMRGKETVDGIVGIMLSAISGKQETVRINGADLPAGTVKTRLLSLNPCHIEYVLDCMKDNAAKIRNIRAYMLTALHNAPDTMDAYYNARINHDLYGCQDDTS